MTGSSHGWVGLLVISASGCSLDRISPSDASLDLSSAKAIAIAVGGLHTCALGAANEVRCWDSADRGAVPYLVVGLGSGVKAIASGGQHSCAIIGDGRVRCWGSNARGQLGNGASTDSALPVDVVSLSNAIAITCGEAHTCAVTALGGVKCWGSNDSGQLGDGASDESLVPVDVSELTSETRSISAGFDHTCAVVSGAVRCWGGAISRGPLEVPHLNSAVAVRAGRRASCARTASGTVMCWGENAGAEPDEIAGVSHVTSLSMAGRYACAVSSGNVNCWGESPIEVSGLGGEIAEIDARDDHACALTTAGIVKCWNRETARAPADVPILP
jgi:alpha-tubulin suppressor-like RCC1 family protein